MDPLNSKKEEDKAVESKCFSKPWKNSDIALVVEGVELHVHRTILCLQSPVFEAMLNGDFKEAKQDKITLEGKDPDEMINFLKLLYPSKTFDNPLNEENLAAILALADEYHTEAVIKQCFDETPITPANALTILPYACKHDESIRQKCINLAQTQIKCQNLKENTSDLEQNLREEIFTGKCELLEDTIAKANEKLIACIKELSRLQIFFEGNFTYKGSAAKYPAGRNRYTLAIPRTPAQAWKPPNIQVFELLKKMDDLLSQMSQMQDSKTNSQSR